MKHLILILLFAIPIFGQYQARDTIEVSKITIEDLQRSIAILDAEIKTLKQEVMRTTASFGTAGEVLGYLEGNLLDQPTSFPIDAWLDGYSQIIATTRLELARLRDSIDAHTTKLYGSSGGTPVYAPVYQFNYDSNLTYGTATLAGTCSTKVLYIKNVGNTTLRITAVLYENTDAADRVSPFNHAITNRVSGLVQDTIYQTDSLKLTVNYCPYDVNYSDSWRLIIKSTGGSDDTLFLTGSGYAVPIATASWRNIGVGGGGWHRAIRKGNVYWYSGSDLGGFIRSSNSGSSWETSNEGLYHLRVEDIAVNTTDRDHLIIGTVGGVYRSMDAGGSWTRSTGDFPSVGYWKQNNQSISAIHWSRADTTICYAGTPNLGHPYYSVGDSLWFKVYKSTNGGATFDSLDLTSKIVYTERKDNQIFGIETNPTDVNEVYLATKNYVYKSTDGGTNWSKLSNHKRELTVDGVGYTKSGSWYITVDSLNPTNVYSAFYGYEGGSYYNANKASRINYNGRNLLLSTNSGTTWAEISHPDMDVRLWMTEEIQFNDTWTTLYVGGRHGQRNTFYKYVPATKTFTLLGIPDDAEEAWDTGSECVFTSFAISGDTIINVPHSWRSTDAGATWKQNYTNDFGSDFYGTTGMEIQVVREIAVNPATGYLYTSNDDAPFKYSTNDGLSWKTNYGVKVSKEGSPNKTLPSTKSMAFKDANTFWVSQVDWNDFTSATILKTTDAGVTFTKATANILPLDNVHIKKLYYKGGDTLFAAKVSAGLWRSTNGGTTWANMSNGASPTNNSKQFGIACAPSNREIMYAGADIPNSSKYGLWKSTNGGLNWVSTLDGSTSYGNVAGNLINCITSVIVDSTNPNIVWISQGDNPSAATRGVGGIWKSTNAGLTWTKKFTLATRDGYAIPYPNFVAVAYYGTLDTLIAAVNGGSPSNSIWYGYGIYKSTDGGENWSEFNTGLEYQSIYSLCTYGNNIYIGKQGNGAAIYKK